MSLASTTAYGHLLQAKRAFGILFVTAAVVASLLTATVLSNSQPTVKVTAAGAVPAAPATVAAPRGAAIPEASTVFEGKEPPEEETAPTF